VQEQEEKSDLDHPARDSSREPKELANNSMSELKQEREKKVNFADQLESGNANPNLGPSRSNRTAHGIKTKMVPNPRDIIDNELKLNDTSHSWANDKQKFLSNEKRFEQLDKKNFQNELSSGEA